MKRNIFLILLLIIISGVVVGIYLYNKPHRNIMVESAAFDLSTDEIYSEFLQDEMAATQKYSEKVVAFRGQIASVKKQENGTLHLLLTGNEGKINCELDPMALEDSALIAEGKKVKIKGLFVGFDGLLEELQFKKCSILKEG